MTYTGGITSAHRTRKLRGYDQLTREERFKVVVCRVEHGLTMRQVSTRFNISDETIRKIIRENNVGKVVNYDG